MIQTAMAPLEHQGRSCDMAGTTVGPRWLGLLLLIALTGCNAFSSSTEEAWDEEFFAAEEEGGASPNAPNSSAGEPAAPAASGTFAGPNESSLKLALRVGNRFPLSKTVDQRLTQLINGQVSVSTTHLELLLALSVLAERGTDRQIGVQYQRVRYAQEIDGQKIEFSSDYPPSSLPPEVAGYAGLAGNGFSFWLGADNRVTRLEGFEEFVGRCALHVPESLRTGLQAQLLADHGPDGVANFVDGSIGLLPIGDAARIQVGSGWELPAQRISQPVPIEINSRCLVQDIAPDATKIAIMGTIQPGTQPIRPIGASDMQVLVRGGQVSGLSRIDPRTGMPLDSQIDRFLEMQIQLADGQTIEQRKEMTTRIAAFLEQPPMSAGAPSAPSRLERVSQSQPLLSVPNP